MLERSSHPNITTCNEMHGLELCLPHVRLDKESASEQRSIRFWAAPFEMTSGGSVTRRWYVRHCQHDRQHTRTHTSTERVSKAPPVCHWRPKLIAMRENREASNRKFASDRNASFGSRGNLSNACNIEQNG